MLQCLTSLKTFLCTLWLCTVHKLHSAPWALKMRKAKNMTWMKKHNFKFYARVKGTPKGYRDWWSHNNIFFEMFPFYFCYFCSYFRNFFLFFLIRYLGVTHDLPTVRIFYLKADINGYVSSQFSPPSRQFLFDTCTITTLQGALVNKCLVENSVWLRIIHRKRSCFCRVSKPVEEVLGPL